MALSKNLALWKSLQSLICRSAAETPAQRRRQRHALAVEALEQRFCPSPVLLVTDANGNQVLAYDATTGAFRGVFVAAGSGGLDSPDLGLMGGPDGNVYVNSYGSGSNPVNSVLRYNGTMGTPLPSTARDGANFVTPNDGGLQGTEGLAFGADGFLYVANDTTQPAYGGVPGNVLRFDASTGNFVSVFVPSGTGGLSYANDLHFGPDGNLYVDNADGSGSNSGKILRYDPTTGDPLPSAGKDGADFITPNEGGLSWANGFAFSPDGMLYVANNFTAAGPANILRYDARGNFVGVFASGLNFVDGIVWGPDGNLYVTNNVGSQGSVNRYDASGSLLNVFVAPGSGGLQFAAGLLFWDLPAASPPAPRRPNPPAAWINSLAPSTPSALAGPVARVVGSGVSPLNSTLTDRFFEAAHVQRQPFVTAKAKQISLSPNAIESTGVFQPDNVVVDVVSAPLPRD